MTTKITPCTKNDLETLQKISIETYSDTFGAQNTEENLKTYLEQAFNLKKLQDELSNPTSKFFFIYYEDQLAGYLKVNYDGAQTEDIAENALEVERIYIRVAFKRNGLGQLLINKAIDCAEELQKKHIWLGVWEENDAALKFYQKMGFVQSGQHSFFMGDDEQTDLIMVKALTE
ncbi:GNAT family N-acetyltransferase [Candidatus Enterococcus clewellii]|uniref:N-acetyltransferase domain-containing protein n=1 Tax=Candidatus Enterococcus clewellii TaxID=1834193 RepID=A0A242KBQ6_9ENTE|nr:GNAT family N-acetyltransferase [Enterococcus sp. 9E7_DIV0242]OTP18603.1 hypothetical protein A5888_000417 [Enterococcus sp. 9E7_DIV0242]